MAPPEGELAEIFDFGLRGRKVLVSPLRQGIRPATSPKGRGHSLSCHWEEQISTVKEVSF